MMDDGARSLALPRLMISAAHKSSGKTTVAVGLAAALRARGCVVQPFKKGPDYIDPGWLARAAGRPCWNLDPWLSDEAEIAAAFAARAAGAGIALVEGNKGLYDGLALDGSNSNAALARMLGLPVVLVLDAQGMTRGIAPLILGYQAFDREIRIAGVVLNQLGGSRHEAKLRAVIEHYTDVPVLGALAHESSLSLTERHLGLEACVEHDDAAERVQALGRRVAEQVDLARVLEVAASAAPLTCAPAARAGVAALTQGEPVRIAVALDKAFGFYYPEDLEALRAAGAEIVALDTLRDAHLPAVDGLLIGGGFPEVFMDALEANAGLRAEIGAAIAGGLPTYAECGGLMYLARSLTWKGRSCRMVGAIAGDATMHERPVGRGYVELQATDLHPWPQSAGTSLRGHEFHYSSLDGLDAATTRYAYRVVRGHGIDGRNDGLVQGNLLACYAHLRSAGGADWPARFVAFVRAERRARVQQHSGAPALAA